MAGISVEPEPNAGDMTAMKSRWDGDATPSSTRARAHAAWPKILGRWLLVLALAGCSTPQKKDLVVGKPYVPDNFHRESDHLPATLRRVAVLPLVSDPSRPDGAAARDSLEPMLLEEIGKTKRFEVVTVTPAKLREWTGKPSWSPEDPLPAKFFENLKERLECDGVLFARVTQFQPYPPLSIGWRMKLVECQSLTALWTIDEVFDSENASVVNAARLYQQHLESQVSHLPVSEGILISPRRFARFSASASLGTLPAR